MITLWKKNTKLVNIMCHLALRFACLHIIAKLTMQEAMGLSNFHLGLLMRSLSLPYFVLHVKVSSFVP
jgi:hypothetical protein